jgi:putative NADPH-quinone reductase
MMTTFTTNDREEAYKKILEEAPAHIGYEDAVDPVACGAAVEPIPFMGLVQLQDQEDREQMLRDQLQILQNENRRLRKKLMEHGDND